MPLLAQRPASRKCALPDTTQTWFAQQRAWLDDSKHDWSSDSLRAVFVSAAKVDASRPLPVQMGWSLLTPGETTKDAAGAALVGALMRGPRGSRFPTRTLVGAAGVRAVWFLTVGDSALEAGVVRRYMEAGLGEAFEADVAVLEDRVRARVGRGQLYGTAMRAGDGGGAPVPYRIEDSAHVDLRRSAAGLPPLAQSVCAAAAVK